MKSNSVRSAHPSDSISSCRMSIRLVIESLRILARAMMQPGPHLDLSFNDRYVAVSKRIVVVGIVAVILTPVLLIVALSLRHP